MDTGAAWPVPFHTGIVRMLDRCLLAGIEVRALPIGIVILCPLICPVCRADGTVAHSLYT